MRLICPNCGAQYEVPESVIPETGRDVQCSSCGHTWFQRHPDQQSPSSEATETADPDDLWDDAEDAGGDSLFDEEEENAHAPAAPQPAPPSTPEAATRPEPEPVTPAAKAASPAQADEDDQDEEWQGFPTDPGLHDSPRAGDRLIPDPEDPVSRLPEVAEDDYEEDPARDLPMPRRGLDTSVADLLREEAEREARARAAERGPGLESQPDLGLDSGTAPNPAPAPAPSTDAAALRRQEDARQRMADLRSPDPVTPQPAAARAPATPPAAPPTPPQMTPAAAQPQRPSTSQDDQIAAAAAAAVAESRRGLLPDIEEINSSLRSTSDRRPARADDHDTPGQPAATQDEPAATRSGFSRGFSVTFLIAMLLLALYIFAPALADAVPALTPAVSAYVAVVDQLRLVLDAQVQNLSRWLAEIAGSTR